MIVIDIISIDVYWVFVFWRRILEIFGYFKIVVMHLFYRTEAYHPIGIHMYILHVYTLHVYENNDKRGDQNVKKTFP